MRKVCSFVLSLAMLTLLFGCGGTGGTATPKVNQEYKSEIAAAAKKLNDTYTNYIIETTVEFSGNTSYHLDVVSGDDIYTEYSIDDENQVGKLAYGSAETLRYSLSDWTHDGIFYGFAADEFGDEYIYKFPANYATKYVYDREMLWVNRFLEGATDIAEYGDLDVNQSDGGVETYKGYRITISPETMKAVLGADSLGIYRSVRDEEKAGSNIAKLCNFYLWDMEDMFTFSKGEAIVGIDQNGILKFMTVDVGGLGTRMYFTKVVVDVSNANVRDLPDFSSAVPMSSQMQELAEMIARYDTNEEIRAALNSAYSDAEDLVLNDPDISTLPFEDEGDVSSEVE